MAEEGNIAETCSVEQLTDLFVSVGIAPSAAKSTVKNERLARDFAALLHQLGVAGGASKAVGTGLYTLMTRWPADVPTTLRPAVGRFIADGQVATSAQVNAALGFVKAADSTAPLDEEAFKAATGVGVTVTQEEIDAAVAKVVDAHAAELRERRYLVPLGTLLGEVRTAIPWADMRAVKATWDAGILALLGPKTPEDYAAAKAAAAAAGGKKSGGGGGGGGKGGGASKADAAPEPEVREFPMPQDNTVRNSAEVLAKHLAATGGKVVTRFPPEPNGFLHVGHVKAICLDFGLAETHGGHCYLRFDDTNPSKEKQEYVDEIIENVTWLGFKPYRITYTSDYFDQLYELACELIRRGKAYVDTTPQEVMRAEREAGTNSKCRDQDVETNLRMFEDMRAGKYREGECCLRMKMDMQNANMCMRDMVAYRIKHEPHARTGDKWCIYPSYDFSHCIVDSLENITHSLCTLEYVIRQPTYYLLLEQLGLYEPLVWEFARLSITGTVLSKRKFLKLIDDGIVDNLSDPRLYTVAGMRRRGYTPKAIRAFIADIGMTRNESMVEASKLEYHLRTDLDARADRRFGVVKPLKVTLANVPDDFSYTATLNNHPADAARGTRTVNMGRVVYIDASDFREQDSSDYYGLAPGKLVRLKNAFHIRCTSVDKDDAGIVTALTCEALLDSTDKVKGSLHWVCAATGVPAEFRLYEPLFKCADPDAAKDWLAEVRRDSVTVFQGFVEPAMRALTPGQHVQLERVGYFTPDTDTSDAKLVLNRCISLKEAAGKADKKKGGATQAAGKGWQPKPRKDKDKKNKAKGKGSQAAAEPATA